MNFSSGLLQCLYEPTQAFPTHSLLSKDHHNYMMLCEPAPLFACLELVPWQLLLVSSSFALQRSWRDTPQPPPLCCSRETLPYAPLILHFFSLRSPKIWQHCHFSPEQVSRGSCWSEPVQQLRSLCVFQLLALSLNIKQYPLFLPAASASFRGMQSNSQLRQCTQKEE